MPSLYFKTIGADRYPIWDYSYRDLNVICIKGGLPDSALLITSLFRHYKGLFVLSELFEEDLEKLSPCLGHYQLNQDSFYINKSYLYFWRQGLSSLESFRYQDLRSTIPDRVT